MRLPNSPKDYDPALEAQRNTIIVQEDRRNMKRDQDIELAPRRLILTSPAGLRWSLIVDDAGVLSAGPLDLSGFSTAFSTAFD